MNFKERKTEREWQESVDNFWRKATPQWFEWLGWVFILGAITFLGEQTKNAVVRAISAISFVALFFYLQGFFYSIEFRGFPLIKSERVRRAVSLLLSAILAWAVWLLLFSLATQIKGQM
jgi:hypothetical protein